MLFNKLAAVAALGSLVTAATSSSGEVPEIVIKGNKFFYSNNGTQFFMRGIAYQTDGHDGSGSNKYVDPLADFKTCSRDIPYLQQLRTNVIRVYALDGKKDHTECMKALADAGIYVIADLSEPSLSINRNSPEWSVELYDRYTQVVDELQKYKNVLGFFAGNEVTNEVNNTEASAFVKAAVRDTKAYIKQKGYRKIPVGYAANDDAKFRDEITAYFACGSNEERADFYGFNVYSWCGDSSFEKSGYSDRTKEFSRLPVPAFFSEYGCNEVKPRKFTDVAALYGDQMTDVWSGGIVYMYFQEANEYGLVTVKGDKVSTLSDFSYYSAQIAKASPTGVQSASYTPSITSLECPTIADNWKAASSLPPTPSKDACKCMMDALSCVVNDSVDKEDYGKLFGYLCGSDKKLCNGIAVDASKGEYGAFSYCSGKEKLSYLLNEYYKANGKSSSACAFSGSASLRKPTEAATCAAVLSSASAGLPAGGNASGSSGAATSTGGSGEPKPSMGTANAKYNMLNVLISSAATLSVFMGFGLIFI
ncbi:AGL352Wp [Eremothecium gossypii ATCC 10895]|uniref:1,3-beta-glucanosyltransferase n=1 Tax=Eremothecium gossypii (strain ATCC 10895 / CBS 109.51 / FGSC 9923 / NRRL Y-1056) TaxID=284811 RepID=Q751P1_EREGS|nr:AGL352Wp [Eremothecium gossypii ATCC 10895]AAS54139.2 AGL352Wp [Eremothecium gossypii ATCC 10895]AEY98465.1 FAGL352Wp [Eremothecium gossypii FDAG1]